MFNQPMNEYVLKFLERPGAILVAADAGPEGARARLESRKQRLILTTDRLEIPLPARWPTFEQPQVRGLGVHGSLVFDAVSHHRDNAWLFGPTGKMGRALSLQGALDATAIEIGFAIGFHPGVAEDVVPSELAETAGIAFFNGEGEQEFTLNDRVRARRIEVHNILAMAASGPTELIFVPESLWQGERVFDCPIAIYDWARNELRWWVSPFLDPLAIAGDGSFAYVYSPIGFENEMMRVDLQTLETKAIGAFLHIQRGLDQGRFLAQIEESSFSIVDPAAPAGPVSYGGLCKESVKKDGLNSRSRGARLELVR